MNNLKGKVAIVTGAARGIGAAIAKKLAECGADVAICDLKEEWCAETVAALEALGVKAKGYGVNVAVSAEVDACVKAVIADFGKVDIMVNNAGITKDGLLMRMSDEDWDAVLNVTDMAERGKERGSVILKRIHCVRSANEKEDTRRRQW